jgi:hypothetical protein
LAAALAEALAQLRGDHASHDIVRTAGRERDDQPHGLRRIALRMRERGAACDEDGE